jgi:chromosome segregation ATPase
LQQRSVKLADVERQVMKLGQENSGLSELANSLTSKLKAAQDEATKAKMESEALSKKVESLGKAVESADPDAADLMSKQAEKIATLETTLQEWIDLAKRSYQEYKDMLPAYKQAEQYRKNALDKEETIKGLQRELTAAKASHNNGDANYWKNKYETLLASVST